MGDRLRLAAITAWVAGVVLVMWQSTCGLVIAVVSAENGSGGSSPGWRSRRRPVDRAAVETGRGPGLQAAPREAGALEGRGEAGRWLLADPPGGDLPLADMDEAPQEGPGGDHDGRAGEPPPVAEKNRNDPAILDFEILDFPRDDLEVGASRGEDPGSPGR